MTIKSFFPRTGAKVSGSPQRGEVLVWTSAQALAFVRRRGIVLEAARGPVPSLAATVAGEPLRGSWWSHPKGKEIFRLSRALRQSPEILVCRVVEGKVTYVHRHLWPALVFLAKRFSKQNLGAIKEVHTAKGRHELLVTPFPDWVPKQVLRVARELKQQEAISQLAAILNVRKKARRTPSENHKIRRRRPGQAVSD